MSALTDSIEAALAATWPAAAMDTTGQFLLRTGEGGGQRVSAATARGTPTPDGIAEAEAAMRARGQAPLFRVRTGEEAFDALLEARGYARHDETEIWSGGTATLAAEELPRGTVFAIWPPLAIMEELWDRAGTGPGRRAVMERAEVPKSGFLARVGDRPSGVAFAGVHAGVAMVHGLWVHEAVRRQKVAHRIMVRTGEWAQDIGVTRLAALCLKNNQSAGKLYASIGFEVVGRYHYRAKKL